MGAIINTIVHATAFGALGSLCMRGNNGGRIVTWIVCGLPFLWAARAAVRTASAPALPDWFVTTQLGAVLASLLISIGIAVLLALPTSSAFFKPAPPEPAGPAEPIAMGPAAQLPVSAVNGGRGVPSCCVRHGNPATLTKRITIASRPPVWSYLFLVPGVIVFALGVIVFVVAVMVLRKTATAPAWPFCDECKRSWLLRVRVGVPLLVLSPLTLIGGTIAAINAEGVALDVLSVLALLSLPMFFIGLIVTSRGGWAAQSMARVSQDGQWVQLKASHPDFVEQLTALQGPADRPHGAAFVD
jgi:hypothetical protein